MSFSFLDSPLPIAFAHRGGSGTGENGLAAFQAVERLGFRYVETDVRTTRDGVPVVFHDSGLERMTGRRESLSELTAAEVGEVSLLSGEPIPTLADSLARFPRLRFNIDLKDDASPRPVADVLERVGALDRVCVTSFSEKRIEAARRLLGSTVCTGLGVAGVLRLVGGSLLPRGLRGAPHGAAVAQMPFSWRGAPLVTRRVVEHAHSAGLALHVWTLNERAEIDRALDLGVDGVMTDRPELLKAILVERGLWAALP